MAKLDCMCRTLALLLLPLALVAAPPAGAKIYKWVLPDGTITYSDRPQEKGAKEMKLPPLQTYTPPPTPAPAPGPGTDKDKPATGYEVVKVVSPQPDEVIRDNGGTVNVRLELKPSLRDGHQVEILLDGKAIGSGASTSASVSNVNRGQHTVSAVVKDAEGKTVASAPGVTFHLKRASRLTPAPAVSAGGS